MTSPHSAKRRKIEETTTSTPNSTFPTNGTGLSSAPRTNGSVSKTNGSILHQRAADSVAASTPSNIDVYDDSTSATNTAALTPTPGLTRTTSRLGLKDRRELSLQASAHGLSSLRARLNAKLAAQEKVKQINGYEDHHPTSAPLHRDSRTGTPRSDVESPARVSEHEAEERKENEKTKFEDEQYEKAIKRMAAKAKAAEKLKAKARGEVWVDLSAPPKATPKAAGVNGVTKKQTPKATPKSATTKALKVSAEVAPVEVVSVSDDTACRVCKRLDSAKTNPMVVCDGCDRAYHQKCHTPPIPNKILKDEDSEWFCAECAFKRAATTGAAPVSLPKQKAKPKPRPKPQSRKSTPVVINGHEDVMDIDEPGDSMTEEHPRPGLMERMKHATSARKEPVRELSPMVLDLPGEEALPPTPSKRPTPAKVIPQPTREPSPTVLQANASADLSVTGEELTWLQKSTLEQLTGHRPNTVVGLDAETQQIANLIGQTISAGESNSLLVIGARGSGKTAVVNSILTKHTLTNADDFHVVRLNGFIHTDDKIALREIWRQLGREMQTEDLDTGNKNYADALTTLLALLSHPSELGQENLDDSNVKSRSVVFILDEFDLFTTHPRQTLLYNLFDIAQSRKAPILVLGLTTRIDVAEQLEKRVKSRFSHRFVHLELAKSLGVFTAMCKSCLTPSTSQGDMQQTTTTTATTENWTALLSDLFSSPEMIAHLRRIYYTTKSIPAFQSSLLIPLSTLPVSTSSTTSTPLPSLLTHLTTTLTESANATAPPDSKLALLPSLSTLHLALLIAAARLSIIHSTDAVGFALAYEHYTSLASRARIHASASGGDGGIVWGGVGRVWGVEVAREAWEGLCGLGFVLVDGAGGGGGMGGGGRAGNKEMVGRVDVLLEEIVEVMGGRGLGTVMRGWCREI